MEEMSRRDRRRLRREMKRTEAKDEMRTERRRKFTKNVSYVIVVIVILGVAGFGISTYTGYASQLPGSYDEFAQCITDKGITMYGAYWCPHCQSQKLDFGNSFKYVDYVECDAKDPAGKGQPALCEQMGITGYPTWIIDDQRYEGEQSLEKLAQITGCSL